MNQAELYRSRAKLLNTIRSFFQSRDFCEVQTPVLVPCPGVEPHMGYFRTTWRTYAAKDHAVWLRSSPELHLKQIVSQELPRVFEIGPCFRNNGELTPWHHPEFSMLEWYEAHASFDDFIRQTSDLIETVWSLFQAPPLPHLKKISVPEAFERFCGIKLVDQDPDLAAQARATRISRSVQPEDDFETAFFKLLIEKVEPGLRDLKFVALYDYPASQAILAKVENGAARRFEFYVHGIELCNGFLELTGRAANQTRFNDAQQVRARRGESPLEMDQGFMTALDLTFPASCGNALGIDRLLSLALGQTNLQNIVPFYHRAPFNADF